MQNVVLIVHLILAVALIAIVLLQRSEGGGLGIGGGGGGGAGGRPKPSPLARVTWLIAIGFLTTSLTLTILAATNSSGRSVLDTATPASTEETGTSSGGLEDNLLPPTSEDDPLLPPKAE